MWPFSRQKREPRVVGPAPRPFDPKDRDRNPVACAAVTGEAEQLSGVAAAFEGQAFQAEADAFLGSFHARPGMTLSDILDADQWSRMRDWFAWDCPEPEPKAIVRLMTRLANDGRSAADLPGLTLFLQGRWSEGGGPSKRSQEWVSVLAQVMGKPITVMFQKVKDGDMLVLRFEP